MEIRNISFDEPLLHTIIVEEKVKILNIGCG
jgi:hypothetical protein